MISNVTYAKFISKTPSCFDEFQLIDAVGIDSNWTRKGIEYLAKRLLCKCGNGNLHVYACNNNGKLLAPVEVECPECGYGAEIFHPRYHGWAGQFEENYSPIGMEKVQIYGTPSEVVVEYSYEGEDSYADLISDGIENAEDFFTFFALYIANDAGGLSELISYDCV